MCTAAPSLAEAMDSSNLVWSTGGASEWFGQVLVTHDGLDAAQSGPIGDSQSSSVQTSVTGPGQLNFWWRVSSESGYDTLQFSIDGTEQNNISGEIPWQQKVFSIGFGIHTLRWEYGKDESLGDGQDRAWLDQVLFNPASQTLPAITNQPRSIIVGEGASVTFSVGAGGSPFPTYQWLFQNSRILNGTNTNYFVRSAGFSNAGTYTVIASNSAGAVTSAPAILTVTSFAAALELTNALWTVGGEGSWFSQTNTTHDGFDAAQSGSISNSEQSWVQTTIIGSGILSFWWKVSSEALYDGMEFMSNGVVVASLSGESQWEQRTFSLPHGPQTLRWRYRKDGSISIGQDRGWLDQVVFLADKPLEPFVFTSIRPLSNRVIQLQLKGEPNLNYYLQASTDLLHWVTMTNSQNSTGNVFFSDQWPTGRIFRSYRVFVP